MNVPQKATLSLLISVLLFAAFTAAAFTGLFDLVEARFYNPQVVRSLNREIQEDTQTITTLLVDLQGRFAHTLNDEAVQRSFLPNQEGDDIFERTRIYGVLLNSLPGLQTVRFVDAGGNRIHFSTLGDDVLNRGDSFLSYRNYRDCPDVLPYKEVETPENGAPRLIFDGQGERLIFSYPFTDSLNVYRGSALFTFSVRGVAQRMIADGRIKVGEDVSVVSSPGGFLLGLPGTEKISLKNEAAVVWGEGILGLSRLESKGGSGEAFALLSNKSRGPLFFVGRFVPEALFVFPPTMKFILLGSFLLTVFLMVFLIFNLRQDSMTVIQSRLKRLQTALMQQYYEHKGDMDWKHWSRELTQRREEIREEVKHGLVRDKEAAGLDTLIDRSWDEMIALIGGRPAVELDEGKLRAIISGVIRQGGLQPPAEEAPAAEEEELEELEEVDDADAADAADAAGAAEVADADPEELEPVEELEELEKVDEAEAVEVLEEVDDTAGETIITPEAFTVKDAGGQEAELEPLDEAPEAELEPLEDAAELEPASEPESARDAALAAEGETISGGDASPVNLAELASQIEFGTVGEATDNGEVSGLNLDVSSPFDALSFESPTFSPVEGAGEQDAANGGNTVPDTVNAVNADDANAGKKKQQTEIAKNNSGLLEITGDGGLPFIYQPFMFQGNGKPQILWPLDEPDGEPIHEQNGVHLIDSEILDNLQENTQKLDPKFLNLVESILNKDKEE